MISCVTCGTMHDRIRFCSNECKDKWHNSNHTRNLVVATIAKNSNTFCDQCGKIHNRKRFCSNQCKNKFHNTANTFSKQLEVNERTLAELIQNIEHGDVENIGGQRHLLSWQQLLSLTFSAMQMETVTAAVCGALEKRQLDKTRFFYKTSIGMMHRWAGEHQHTPGVTVHRCVSDIVSSSFDDVKEKVVDKILMNPNIFAEDSEKLRRFMFSYTKDNKYLNVEVAGLFVF